MLQERRISQLGESHESLHASPVPMQTEPLRQAHGIVSHCEVLRHALKALLQQVLILHDECSIM